MATIYKSVEVTGNADQLQKDLDALTDDSWTYTDMVPLVVQDLKMIGPTGRIEDNVRRTYVSFMLIMQKTV